MINYSDCQHECSFQILSSIVQFLFGYTNWRINSSTCLRIILGWQSDQSCSMKNIFSTLLLISAFTIKAQEVIQFPANPFSPL